MVAVENLADFLRTFLGVAGTSARQFVRPVAGVEVHGSTASKR
jgi:hypothetical protein